MKLGAAGLSVSEELAQFEHMFRRLGVNPADVTPEKLIAACQLQVGPHLWQVKMHMMSSCDGDDVGRLVVAPSPE